MSLVAADVLYVRHIIMKTFRWTMPDLPMSRAEKKHSEELSLRKRGIPTKNELDEYRRWEEVARRGYLVWFVRVAVITGAVCLTLLFLRSQDILISRDSSIVPLFGGLAGGAMGSFLSWRRYTESRERIRTYLKEQGEQAGTGQPATRPELDSEGSSR